MKENTPRHLTPAPLPRSKFATVADAFDVVADHENGCAARRRKFSMWAITTGLTVLGITVTIGIFVAKFLIVGAITLELDRRFPAHSIAADSPGPSIISTAQAATK